MDVSRMPKEGDKFGNWIIERTLDKGGMGMVYLAYNPDLGKSEKVALKVLDPAVAEKDADFVKRFYQEASIVFKTHCPNLVAIHDAGRDASSGFYYIVMEYLGGGTLRERMRIRGPMPWREALSIVRPVALALAAVAKRKSVHRDIKPENIMFTADGEVKLADFGIAKASQDQADGTVDPVKTRCMQIFGTPAYMSPEQITDASAVDARADIWSLGVVLFEMLAGARPYPARDLQQAGAFLLSPRPIPDIRTFKVSPVEEGISSRTAVTLKTLPTMVTQIASGDAKPSGPAIAPDVPDGVADLLSRMCEKRLEKRIPTGEKVVAIIDNLLGRVVEPETNEQSAKPTRSSSRKTLRMICAGLLVLLIGLCAVAIFKRRPAPVDFKSFDENSAVKNEVTSERTGTLPEPSEAAAETNALPILEVQTNLTSTSQSQSSLFQPQRGSIGAILSQLDRAVGKNPLHLRVSLSVYAKERDLSVERYEQQLLVPAVERLRNSEVNFSLVAGAGKYGSVVRDVAKRFGCEVE